MIRPRDLRDRVANENQALVQGGYCVAAGLILRAIAVRKRSRLGRLAGGALAGVGSALLLRSVRIAGKRKSRPLATIASSFVGGLDAVQLLHRRGRWRILGTLAELAMAIAWLRRAARSAPPASLEGPEVEATPPEQILDHALEETFPASDPVVITPPERREPPPQL